MRRVATFCLVLVAMMLTGCDHAAAEKAMDEVVAVFSDVNSALDGVHRHSDLSAAVAKIDAATNRLASIQSANPNLHRQKVGRLKFEASKREMEAIGRKFEANILRIVTLGPRDSNFVASLEDFQSALEGMSSGSRISMARPRIAIAAAPEVSNAPPPGMQFQNRFEAQQNQMREMQSQSLSAEVARRQEERLAAQRRSEQWQSEQNQRADQQIAQMRQREADEASRAATASRERASRAAALQARVTGVEPAPPTPAPASPRPAPSAPSTPAAPRGPASPPTRPPAPAAPQPPAAPAEPTNVSPEDPANLAPAKLGAGRPQVGARVFGLKSGKWWPATVLKLNTEKTLVHYDGQPASGDEWLPFTRLRVAK